MRLLVDAQLPVRLASLLADLGHDVVHTSQLPLGNRTPDTEIVRAADSDARVVVTKDRDFLDSHILSARPRSLLLVSTGNISNDELIGLFVANMDRIVAACDTSGLVELSRVAIVVHGP
jgi:predicted nuclease of predicted toxin-antitoxin system